MTERLISVKPQLIVLATILIDQQIEPVLPVQKLIKQSDLDSLQRRLDLAEASRLEAQTDYQQMRIKYQQLNQEKELLEHLLIEKNQLIQSEMVVWINSKSILKYYEGKWRDRMGLKINHEGLIIGYVY